MYLYLPIVWFWFLHTGELATAIRAKTDIHFGLYHSLFEWFNPLYLADKKNKFKTNEYVKVSYMYTKYDFI